MHTRILGFESFADLYPTDAFFAKIHADVQFGLLDEYSLLDGFLFHGLCLCIPDCSLCLQIISELHNEGHVGRDRTLHLVSTS